MNINIPELSLVVLIGPSGSGKSTFARRHFRATEVLSSDWCRGLVSDDENSQAATADAFAVLHFVASKRLAAGRLTVIDATSVQPESRQPLVQLAREFHVLPVALVFNLPEDVCSERNRGRADRNFGPHVVRQQRTQLRRGLKGLKREGFRHVFVFESEAEVEAAAVSRTPLWNNRKDDLGPFDFIGDVHGCCDELEELLRKLGYERRPLKPDGEAEGMVAVTECARHYPFLHVHPAGRKAVFVGDLVDRGPRVFDSLCLVHNMVSAGQGLSVPGNHDVKLMRALNGKQVQVAHGLAQSLAEFEALADDKRGPLGEEIRVFLDGLVSHYLLDRGRIVVAHAGMKESMQGRGSSRVRDFALYGETTGETDEFGLPVRHNWAAGYRGDAMVVYGHTPVPVPEWLNRTINIDTGCVFGGALTALRYPELELVQVKARRTYCEPARSFLAIDQKSPGLSLQQQHDDLLDLADVSGKRIVTTRLHHAVTIRAENATAALEVMSRFAADPRWLVYLPPTIAPPETHAGDGFLEHPDEVFSYFLHQGVARVICEEKHMGSRAVIVICRDSETAARRFGVSDEAGIILTRTGRRFFDDDALQAGLLDRVRAALDAACFWDEHQTGWVVLDCELMPWSAKAQELLKTQYAAVGSAARAALPVANHALARTVKRLTGEAQLLAEGLRERFDCRQSAAARFVEAYRRYCWPIDSLDDFRIAPFHLLATERGVHVSQPHDWHMETVEKFCRHEPQVLVATRHRIVDVTDPTGVEAATAWWLELTGAGGEGMVVKPLEFIARGKRGLVQPAVKCRGREYLRIIYGPDYDRPESLERLRRRGLAVKRSLALREFALGVEGLERFVRHEPLRRVHECVFGVLALESEPVDPRL